MDGRVGEIERRRKEKGRFEKKRKRTGSEEGEASREV
jgi:hypothetical protein